MRGAERRQELANIYDLEASLILVLLVRRSPRYLFDQSARAGRRTETAGKSDDCGSGHLVLALSLKNAGRSRGKMYINIEKENCVFVAACKIPFLCFWRL
ncbi:hypothetical protein [Mesorhizobium sp. M0955]|uniref:hypothetical protein n=1 Tax=unclassified Mesorhizobium TaxID=325217 RepID=UPI00333665C4